MHETINAKIPDSKMDPYIVFGACNAKYAYEMLEMEEKSEVVIMNPSVILSVSKNDDITSYSTSVTKKLKKVLEAL
jgi:uncharacterized protein (DUF302 family)